MAAAFKSMISSSGCDCFGKGVYVHMSHEFAHETIVISVLCLSVCLSVLLERVRTSN